MYMSRQHWLLPLTMTSCPKASGLLFNTLPTCLTLCCSLGIGTVPEKGLRIPWLSDREREHEM